MSISPSRSEQIRLGWREWVSLPALNVPYIKAKVDTGARTSALHTFELETFHQSGRFMVHFGLHPLQRRHDIVLHCIAEVIDERWVSDSGGHRERRYVIHTPVNLGGREWPIEVTLTNRDTMQFRMLLGRTALKGNVAIKPGSSYLAGKPNELKIKNSYK